MHRPPPQLMAPHQLPRQEAPHTCGHLSWDHGLQEGDTFFPQVPCNLSSLETFCRLIFRWAERGRHGDTEEKEKGSICGRKKRTQKGKGPRRLPRTRAEEKPDSEPGASAVLPDIAAHRCKQPCSVCVCVCVVFPQNP